MVAIRRTGAALAAGMIALVAVAGCGDRGEQTELPVQAAPKPRIDFDPHKMPIVKYDEAAGANALPRLSQALFNEDLDPTVRAWVALQVAQISSRGATDVLIKATADPNAEVARAAVESLAGRSGPGVEEALEAAAGSSDPAVARHAREILNGGSGSESSGS